MRKDKVLLRKEVEDTANHLADNILKLEQRVAQGVQTFSPAHLIRRHPVSTVGTAALIGFAATYWHRKIRPLVAEIANELGPEIKLATKIGAGFLVEKFSEQLSMLAEKGEENTSSDKVRSPHEQR